MAFSADLRRFASKAGTNADQVVKKICLDLTTRIVYKTPVDTGRLRGNWQPSIGSPITTTIEVNDRSGGGVIAKTVAMVQNAPGSIFWLSNNLPYAAIAEYGLYGKPPGTANGPKTRAGYSTQAPAGFVRISVDEIMRSIR